MAYTQGKYPDSEGKTKVIWPVVEDSSLVIVNNKPVITAFDNPALTQILPGKDVWATTTTCRIFEFLRLAGIPVAYHEQLSPTTFLADFCHMIPTEEVARGYATGSYCERNTDPKFKVEPGQPLYQFPEVIREHFLKTSHGQLWSKCRLLVDGLDPLKGEEDPLIFNPFEKEWVLVHPKKPTANPESVLGKTVLAQDIIPDSTSILTMDAILKQVFEELAAAWEILGLYLIDLKIEFGITTSGELKVADVIDNDSHRLRTKNWEELSKQVFRDGGKPAQVAKNYQLVADLVGSFV